MSGISSLNSMISTAIKMQAVRRHADMSKQMKDDLLGKLQKQNGGIAETSELQAEGAEKGGALSSDGESGASGSGAIPGGSGGATFTRFA